MSLRRRFVLYLVLVHLPFVAAAVWVLENQRWMLLAVEALFLMSFLAGLRLVGALFGPLEVVRSGAQFLLDSDFSSRFRETGRPEMDDLVRIYNRMADHLREERIRMEERQYFLEKVLRASPAGIVTLDFDGRVATVNPSAEELLRGANSSLRSRELAHHGEIAVDRSDLVGRRLSEIDGGLAHELAALETGQTRVIALMGSRRIKCHRSEFLDRGFARPFYVLEEMTEELRQSEKAAYGKLIRMMSHEVNNSVGAAASLLQSCLHYKDQVREDDREDFAGALEVVIGRTVRLSEFMRGFSDVVRIPPPKRTPTDLRALLEQTVALFSAEARARSVSWRWELETPRAAGRGLDAHPSLDFPDPALSRSSGRMAPGSQDWTVSFDPAQIEQVLVNVLKNALEAIGQNGTITLRLGRVGPRARLIVEDTGGALTPEVQASLFTPFFSTKPNGQGIGLTTVKEILIQHGFEFSLTAGPDSTTRFTILF